MFYFINIYNNYYKFIYFIKHRTQGAARDISENDKIFYSNLLWKSIPLSSDDCISNNEFKISWDISTDNLLTTVLIKESIKNMHNEFESNDEIENDVEDNISISKISEIPLNYLKLTNIIMGKLKSDELFNDDQIWIEFGL